MKTFLKKIINWGSTIKYFYFDAMRYIKYSNTSNKLKNENQYVGTIIKKYHVIEKGLTMPEMRFGFGVDKINSLLDDCLNYYKKYGDDNVQFKHALNVIAEYINIHSIEKMEIDPLIASKYETLRRIIPDISSTEQLVYTKEKYLKDVNSSFDEFSNSRHSLRNFTGTVDNKLVEKAVLLAQNYPSACNRQPARVHIVVNKNTKEKILKLQNGNRGFGHLADKILLITIDLSGYNGLNERNLQFIDGGIFTMNLLYSLHFYGIGACTLNWGVPPRIDKSLREFIEIPKSESVVVLIACGNIPNKFKITLSKKNEIIPFKTH